MLIDLLIVFFLLLGSSFALIGSIGLVRLPDIFARLHGPTKATTLGVGSILLGSILYFSSRQGLSLQEILALLFLFMTAPVSAQLLSRAALHRRCDSIARLPEMDDGAEKKSGNS
ncbi:MAG: Na+/H+ antiporter subunit G [Gammaproteobacteria bacterium]|nr:Na+/H+ antiporter subunit G [Gammaproteobacteria bacterium]